MARGEERFVSMDLFTGTGNVTRRLLRNTIMTRNPGTYHELECDVLLLTRMAIKVDTGGERRPEDIYWVPKSLLDADEHTDDPEKGNGQVLYVARWFLEKEGII